MSDCCSCHIDSPCEYCVNLTEEEINKVEYTEERED